MKNSNLEKIIVKVKASGEYDVIIASGLLSQVGEMLKTIVPFDTVAVITDDVVDALYSKTVVQSIISAGFKAVKFVFKNGEQSKNIDTYAQILNFLAQNKLTRTDLILALGGGVVGDMAGFCSATYLRGIKYVQVPTTLLAQVDSSVGGKTAIDLAQGKNLVGAFKQPELVICDTDALKTLPREVFVDGMGECAKYALLDERIFNLINKGNYSIDQLVYLCVDYKRAIVEQDEFESGNRKLLNLGHTVAHAIEKKSGYSIAHGRAVAMGLETILSASKKHGYIDEQTYGEMKCVVEKCVGENPCPFAIKELCQYVENDKKRSGEYITFVTVHGVGDCRFEKIKVQNTWEFLK